MSGLRFDRHGAIARLTLDRPSIGNTIDLPLAQDLLATAIECDEDDGIRCVILSGTGRYFCLGGDVSTFAEADERLPQLLKQITAALHMAVTRLAHMNKPLITAINGTAAGAGLSLAVLGDLAIAAASRSSHGREGLTAFVQKRPANFSC